MDTLKLKVKCIKQQVVEAHPQVLSAFWFSNTEALGWWSVIRCHPFQFKSCSYQTWNHDFYLSVCSFWIEIHQTTKIRDLLSLVLLIIICSFMIDNQWHNSSIDCLCPLLMTDRQNLSIICDRLLFSSFQLISQSISSHHLSAVMEENWLSDVSERSDSFIKFPFCQCKEILLLLLSWCCIC